jgi:hypothetical protein
MSAPYVLLEQLSGHLQSSDPRLGGDAYCQTWICLFERSRLRSPQPRHFRITVLRYPSPHFSGIERPKAYTAISGHENATLNSSPSLILNSGLTSISPSENLAVIWGVSTRVLYQRSPHRDHADRGTRTRSDTRPAHIRDRDRNTANPDRGTSWKGSVETLQQLFKRRGKPTAPPARSHCFANSSRARSTQLVGQLIQFRLGIDCPVDARYVITTYFSPESCDYVGSAFLRSPT